MEKFSVAAVQINALRDDLEHNLAAHRRIIAEAAEAGARLVAFPELSATGHYGDECGWLGLFAGTRARG